jgi:hypothetical protein
MGTSSRNKVFIYKMTIDALFIVQQTGTNNAIKEWKRSPLYLVIAIAITRLYHQDA